MTYKERSEFVQNSNNSMEKQKTDTQKTPSVDLDKIATSIYNSLKKKDLTVEDVRSVTYRVNRKVAQNSRI